MTLAAFRFGLLALIAAGCIWVILTPSEATESNAAFAMLGVIVAGLGRVGNFPTKDQ